MKLKYGIIISILIIIIIGCGPPEGERLYKETWEKTTVRENILYKKSNVMWSDETLKYVRQALRKRKMKPNENAYPFIDIKDVIIQTNDTLMDINTVGASLKEKYTRTKFENIDPVWYRGLLTSNNVPQDKLSDQNDFKFSNDLLLDCEKKINGERKVILYVGRKLYYVSEKDEWGDLDPVFCGGKKNEIKK